MANPYHGVFLSAPVRLLSRSARSGPGRFYSGPGRDPGDARQEVDPAQDELGTAGGEEHPADGGGLLHLRRGRGGQGYQVGDVRDERIEIEHGLPFLCGAKRGTQVVVPAGFSRQTFFGLVESYSPGGCPEPGQATHAGACSFTLSGQVLGSRCPC